jgi:hypothetical protein
LVLLVGIGVACGVDGAGRGAQPETHPGEVGDAGDEALGTEGGPDGDGLFGDDSSLFGSLSGDAGDGGLICYASGGGGGSGSSCDITDSWTCTDGTYPQAHCTCPAGTCDCTVGSTTIHAVPFHGCPMCPGTDQAATICGIPH